MEETPTAFFAGLDVAGAPRELVALGGRLDVETLLAAYRAGCFPWPATGRYEASLDRDARRLVRRGEVPLVPGTDLRPAPLMPWISPHPRPVLFPDHVVLPRSLRRRLRICGWETTMDRAFDDVVAGCADRGDADETWITPAIRDAYARLHRLGWAHSVEVWVDGALAGGLYGVAIGGLFSAESMFHRRTDASKVALVALAQHARAVGVELIDVQMPTPHLTAMGARTLARDAYLAALARAVARPVNFAGGDGVSPVQ
jgi:leucyl/phenylalanyl-tRNA--protein transferase